MSFNDYAVRNNARALLGASCAVTVKRSYRAFKDGRFAGYLNCGYTTLPKVGAKEVILIGENLPVAKFSGQIIAIAHDKSGAKDDVLIAARENSVYYEPHIACLVERFFAKDETEFVCFYEKSCGAVLFSGKGADRRYILITNISGHIGFPKGHIEYGESEKQTALREVYEETGVHTELIDGFREFYNYRINSFIRKKAIYYLAAFDPADVRMNIREISEYRLLSYEEAMETLGFRHDKKILEKAEAFIRARFDNPA